MKITLAMKDDWQGNAGDPVIGQGDNQDTYHDFHQLPARLHDPFFLLPPLPKRKRQSVTHISTHSRLSAGSERISWRGFGTDSARTRAASSVVVRLCPEETHSTFHRLPEAAHVTYATKAASFRPAGNTPVEALAQDPGTAGDDASLSSCGLHGPEFSQPLFNPLGVGGPRPHDPRMGECSPLRGK